MIIFNQQLLLETHPTKTQQPNDPTLTKKMNDDKEEEEEEKEEEKSVNTCVPTK